MPGWEGHQVSIDSGHQLPGGSARTAETAGALRRLAFGAVPLVAVISAGIATSAWSLREHALLAVVAILAVIVSLLLRRHRLSDQRLAAERRQLSIAVN